MSTWGGITAQQYVRKVHGIDVRHTITAEGYHAEVVKDSQVVMRYPDDCLASNTIIVFQKIYRMLRPGKIEHYMSPASICLGDRIKGVIDDFDFPKFEAVLLPELRKQQSLDNAIAEYTRLKDCKNVGEQYELFHYLCSLIQYARNHNLTVSREGISGYVVTGSEQALHGGAECVLLDRALLTPALKILYKDHKEVTIGTGADVKIYLVQEKPINVFECARGEPVVLDESQFEVLRGGNPAFLHTATCIANSK